MSEPAMPNFTAKDVQALRQSMGVGMMDAKKALEECDGDMESAEKLLRERGLAKAAKLADRENEQGAVAVVLEGNVAAMVELKSETDFAAKSPDFVGLVEELAELVAARVEGAVGEKQEALDQLKLSKKENIQLGEVVRFEVPAGHVIDAYLHKQDDRGVVGVLVELDDKGTVEQAHELALHIAFKKPRYLSRDDVPEADVDAEREMLTELTRKKEVEEEGKPEQALPKIVEGKLGKWFEDQVLLEQSLFDEKGRAVTAELGEARLVRFAVAAVGD
ncbi:MAG: translation elongation factor Ts [Acidimicrobiia bacterium]|nr:translation elongation factor Ts [Acidimicrobiia bacterium]